VTTGARRTTVLVATAALVFAGCGAASDDRTGVTATSTASQASVTVAPKPAWVPRRLQDRFAARRPREPGCGFYTNAQRTTQYVFNVSGGARCRTALLVLADFDANLSKADLTRSCDYRLCEPRSRIYRGYRCRLVHLFDGAYEYACTRGSRKVGFGFEG
jgi:hypothetical protein